MNDIENIKEYIGWKIDRCAPVTFKYQMENWVKHRWWDFGTSWNNLPTYETWKKIYKKL